MRRRVVKKTENDREENQRGTGRRGMEIAVQREGKTFKKMEKKGKGRRWKDGRKGEIHNEALNNGRMGRGREGWGEGGTEG